MFSSFLEILTVNNCAYFITYCHVFSLQIIAAIASFILVGQIRKEDRDLPDKNWNDEFIFFVNRGFEGNRPMGAIINTGYGDL